MRYNTRMALSWGKRRKFLYTAVAAVIGLVVLALVYNAFFNNAPTCFDGAQNGTERGVDCGGSCALVCKADARSPKVLWNRVFEVAPHVYTAAAYIQNPNIGAGARDVRYSFQLFDEKNNLVIERIGTMSLPPVQTIPVIEANIDVGTRSVSKALFAFSAEPVWYKGGTLPLLRVGNQYLAPDGSQLSATITNESLTDANKVTVAAVLFDGAGVARAASKSVFTRIPRKSSAPVVFTWAGGVPNIVRAEITVLPSF